MKLETFILMLAAGRIAIGLSPIVASTATSRLLGFPEEHDNATARIMARMFGIRDIGLGVIAIAAVYGLVDMTFALLFNAATDLGDAGVIAVPLVKRQGIDRAASLSMGMAVFGGCMWMIAHTFF